MEAGLSAVEELGKHSLGPGNSVVGESPWASRGPTYTP